MAENIEAKSVEEEMFLVDDKEETSLTDKYLLFNLGNEEYGIDISRVTGIEELQKITRVPDMPEYMKGVINLRGRVIPVIDLRLRFGMEERAYDDRTCIIVCDVQDMTIGLIVDTVTVVSDIEERDIEPPPSFKTESGKERYISGLARIDDEVKILLNVEKILKEEEIHRIQEGS